MRDGVDLPRPGAGVSPPPTCMRCGRTIALGEMFISNGCGVDHEKCPAPACDIKPGDHFVHVDRPKFVMLCTARRPGEGQVISDQGAFLPEHCVRVHVVPAKPRRTLKPSEALAWLMAQEGWSCGASHESPVARRWHASVRHDSRGSVGIGVTLTKAIIVLRKLRGVR